MKLRFAAVATLFVSLVILANINVAKAEWSAISSGYAVTTNRHGEDVPLHADVIAIAGTTDSSVDEIEFRWLDPYGNPVSEWTETIPVPTTPSVTPYELPSDAPQEIMDWADKNQGIEYWWVESTPRAPSVIGDWTVKAIFHGPISQKGQAHDMFRATSFFAVDEVPIGTIVMLLIPFGFFGIYAIKRKRNIYTATA